MKAPLSTADRQRVEAAVAAAEKETSGEIVVCLHRHVRGDIESAARDFFVTNGLHKTARRNAVLVLIALGNRQVAVLGDEGIDAVVPADFWEQTVATMTARFAAGDLAGGIEAGVRDIGDRLREFFPWQEEDVNELPNTIREVTE